MNKKHLKQIRKGIERRGCDQASSHFRNHRDQWVPFEDNKGRKLKLRSDLTIDDLARMGVQDIRFMPKGSPIPDGYVRSISSPLNP